MARPPTGQRLKSLFHRIGSTSCQGEKTLFQRSIQGYRINVVHPPRMSAFFKDLSMDDIFKLNKTWIQYGEDAKFLAVFKIKHNPPNHSLPKGSH